MKYENTCAIFTIIGMPPAVNLGMILTPYDTFPYPIVTGFFVYLTWATIIYSLGNFFAQKKTNNEKKLRSSK